MALALAEAGAEVILTGRTAASLQATAAEVEARGRRAFTFEADMGVPAECEAICSRALQEAGPLDVLINNIGGRRENVPIEAESIETWRRLLDLNLTTCFIATKLIGGAMVARGQGGRIINMASINALVAARGIAGRHYEAAKAAVLQFTRAAAADWAPNGITVNAICPGLFMTDANKRWRETSPQIIQGLIANIPMGRAGEPGELGALAVYLASPASSYVTGAAFVIDGGYTLW
jgi:gluconate 5-dehydrogenase